MLFGDVHLLMSLNIVVASYINIAIEQPIIVIAL